MKHEEHKITLTRNTSRLLEKVASDNKSAFIEDALWLTNKIKLASTRYRLPREQRGTRGRPPKEKDDAGEMD